MVISIKEHKIAYWAIPKVASSSVKTAFAQIEGKVPPDADLDDDVLPIHRVYPTMRFNGPRWDLYHGYWRFTVVRDPIKRMMSVYTDLVASGRILPNSPKMRQGFMDLPMHPDPDVFFQNREHYMEANSAMKHHLLTMTLFTGRDLMVFDRVYKTSELDELAGDLAQKTGVPVRMDQKNPSGEKLRFDDLKPETRDALVPVLRSEYRALRPFYTDPFA